MMQSEKSHHKRHFNHLHTLITQKYISFFVRAAAVIYGGPELTFSSCYFCDFIAAAS